MNNWRNGAKRHEHTARHAKLKSAGYLLALLLAGHAQASQQTGLVVDVRVSSTAVLNPTHIQLDGTWTGKPGCATTIYWAIDTDSVLGRNLLAVILAAQASGQPVTFYGANTCTLRTDMETAVQVQLAQ